MPKFEVDDDVFVALQELAVPLVDDANSVLRRLLGLDGERFKEVTGTPGERSASKTRRAPKQKSRAKKRRAPKGSLLPEEAYAWPILEALVDAGGRGPTSEVINSVGERLNGELKEIDREVLKGGEVRWKNRAQFARLKLIQAGLMESDSPRGIWAISEAGREYLLRERS